MDPIVIREYVEKGLLRTQKHPVHPLQVVNYSALTQARQMWDDITSTCRGLVIDAQGDVVARSFKKFHNIDQNMHCATNDFVVQEKLDGSLILIFHYAGEWIVASRGSFTSEQSSKAKELIEERYTLEHLDPDLSYVFEIIYPSNRIVVDYDKREELVFLASFRKDGSEVFDSEAVMRCGFNVVQEYPFSDYTGIQALDWANCEGFVVRFSNGERVKIKFQNYVDLHRIVTRLSDTTVWEWFKTGDGYEEYLKQVPDEWHAWYTDAWNDLTSKYDAILEEARTMLETHAGKTKKEFALAIKNELNRGLLFALFDRKDCHRIISDMIKPSGTKCEAPVLVDTTLPTAFVFDLDGTLAVGERDAYDWTRVEEDDVNAAVRDCATALCAAGHAIIICSGRPDTCREGSVRWLKQHDIPFSEIHMRRRGDRRRDCEVKQDLWRGIQNRFVIRGMFDDRTQVVERARALGFIVFQVAKGDF